MTLRAAALLPVFLVGAAACANLPPLASGECGNGVIDPGEDCDTLVDPSLGSGARCGSPGLGVRACKLVCETPAGCPTDWGCSRAGVCVLARGAIAEGWQVAAGSPFSMPADMISVGDVDGDGLLDVAGFSGARVGARYGSGDGRFAAETTLGTEFALQLPAFARIDDDGRLDTIVVLPSGIHTLRGTSDRTLSPFAHTARQGPTPSSADFYLPVRTRRADGGHDLIHFAGAQMALFDQLLVEDTALAEALPDEHTTAELAGRVPVADLDGDGVDELVLAFSASSEVYVFSAARDGAPVLRARLALPADYAVLDGAQIVDTDGDGRLDVLVGMRARFGVLESQTGIARAAAPGVLGPVEPAPRFDGLITAGCGTSQWPLAAGDLDGDGVADYVGTLGVCITRDSGFVLGGPNPSPGGWTGATIADFNHDGRRDVAAATRGLSNVDFLLSDPAGSGLFNYARTVTGGPSGDIVAGDYNGDFVADLAVVESRAPRDAVSVIFGTAGGLPGAAEPMGSFAPIARIDAALLNAGGASDLTSDLIVDEIVGPGGGERALTFLHGNAQRAMAAPFPLRVEAGVFDLPGGIVAGDFDGDGNNDAAVFVTDGTAATHGQLRAWLLRGDGSGRWARPIRSSILGPPFDPACALLAPAQLGPGPQAILIAAGSGPCFGGPRFPALGVVRFAGMDAALQLTQLDPAQLATPNSLDVADLDGDDVPEVIVTFLDSGTVGIYETGGGTVAFGAPATRITGFAGSPLAAAPIHADGDADVELAILTDQGLFIADPDGAGGYAVVGPVLQTGVPTATRLTAVDLDGDGLQDLVFNSPGQVHVYLAVGQTLSETR